jgi:hypothetical protein
MVRGDERINWERATPIGYQAANPKEDVMEVGASSSS